VFFSTLGGLLLFGVMGFVLGPILAALFITVWEMFGTTFRRSPPTTWSQHRAR
jgi:predicted PurR-regulated permease PerM